MNSKWMKGTMILTITAFLTKLLSMVYKIPYQNIVGDEGLYVFQQVYPLIGIYTVLNGLVFPTIVSELLLKHQYSEDIKQYIKRSLWIFGVVSFGLLFLGSERLALLMGDIQLSMSIRIIGVAFLLIPTLSYLRGVAQTRESTIHRVGYSTTIEQFVRVFMIIMVLFLFSQRNIYQISYLSFLLGLMGPILALVYLTLFKIDDSPKSFLKLQTKPKLLKNGFFLFLSAGILIVFQLIDSFFVFNSLISGGLDALEAMQQKGIYDRGLPIIQAATFFIGAVVTSTIPQMSKLKEEKQRKNMFNSALFFVIAFSIPACVGLFLVIEDLNTALFMDNSGTRALQIMTFQVLLYPFVFLTTAVLQQEGKESQLLVSILLGIFVKLMSTAPLTNLFGIEGAAISSVLSLGAMYLVNLYQFRKMIYKQSFLNILKVSISTIGMWLAIDYLGPIILNHLAIEGERLLSITSLVVQVGIGVLVYGIFIILFILTSKSPTVSTKQKKRKSRRQKI